MGTKCRFLLFVVGLSQLGCESKEDGSFDINNPSPKPIKIQLSLISDLDGDGVLDLNDNCPYTKNPSQANQDGDDLGDLCDLDIDGDFIDNHDDCAPLDSTRFQKLSYQFRDADSDGYTVETSGDVCTGEELPKGFLIQAGESDCNDNSAELNIYRIGFKDNDGDGYGAGQPILFCTNGDLPLGSSRTDTDCNDDNDQIYQDLCKRIFTHIYSKS
jgi:hypothetical protein